MKILYVQDSLGSGGAERSNAELWYFLKKKDISLKIVVLKRIEHGVEKEVLDNKLDVVFLKEGNLISHVKTIKRIIKTFRPDLVHSVLFKSALRVRLARLMINFCHLESLVNCTYDKSRLNDPNVNSIKLLSYRAIDYLSQIVGVDHFHANGKTVANHYKEMLFIDPSRITIVPRGRKNNIFINNEENKRAIRNEFKSDNKIQLINVARHEYQKAQEVLVEACSKIENFNKNYLLLIVGRLGENTNEIKNKVAQLGLEDCIKITGFRKDVYNLLAASDIFVFPSRFEGLPGALIEAEAAGLPIICSNIPNNSEVVMKNKNALIFPMDDVDSLTQCMNILLSDKNKRFEMGKESLVLFKNNFTIEAVHEKMLDMYYRLAQIEEGNMKYSGSINKKQVQKQ